MLREVTIVAGPNGAGKTTLALEYQRVYGYPYVGADLIAAELNPDRPEEARIQAGRLLYERIATLVAAGNSFIVESTLAGRGVERIITDLEGAGYSVRIAFVFLDSHELCIRRIRERVLQGGHDVPEEDVRRRFYRSLHNFWETYRYACDEWHFIYNAAGTFQQVAFGTLDTFIINDEVLLQAFLSLIEGDVNGAP